MDISNFIQSFIQQYMGFKILSFNVGQWLMLIATLSTAVNVVLKVLVSFGVPLQSEIGWVDKILALLTAIGIHPSSAQVRKPIQPAAKKPTPVPPPAAAAALLLGLSTLLCAATARAEFTMGPSAPLLRVGLGDGPNGVAEVSFLEAGIGYAVSYELFPITFNGSQWNMLTPSLTTFFGAQSSSGVNLSEALSIGTLNNTIGVGFGIDLLNSTTPSLSGVLAANVTKFNLFTVALVNINYFTFSQPATGTDGKPLYHRGMLWDLFG
jgi:hypothetical protein